jgi:hypothetical protein
MKELTKEQKEYVKLKLAFERMFKNLDNFTNIDGNQCLPIYNNNDMHDVDYKIEVVFKNLLDNYKA